MSVLEEVLEAYADCGLMERDNLSYDEALSRRHLMFRASQFVSRSEAIEICEQAIIEYNNFQPALLKHLPKNSQILIAREMSVCIYVKGKIKRSSKMMEDSFDFDPTTQLTCIWWD